MKRLLVVVDYQKDFVDGSLGFPEARALEEPICRKIEEYQKQKADIVFTYDTHNPDYLQTQEGTKLPVSHCLKDSPGWQLYGRVGSYCTDMTPCFYKPAFGSMELAHFVQEKGYDSVELCGLVSNICVISNAVLVKAALPEARVLVDAQCTGSGDAVLHEKALDVMEGLQIEVYHRAG